jgi:hypothetical protein
VISRILKLILLTALAIGACRDKKNASGLPAGENRNQKHNERNGSQRESGFSNIEAILNFHEGGAQLTTTEYGQLEKRVASLSNADLKQLLDITGKGRNSLASRSYFTLAISELARRDPVDAMSWFSPEDMIPGEAGFMAVANILAKSDGKVLQDWLRDNLSRGSSAVRNECLTVSLAALSAEDASSALTFYSSNNWGSVSDTDIINAIFRRFGKQSPLAADAAAAGKLKGSELDLARYNISNGAGPADPVLGIEIARKIVDIDLRGKALSGRLSSWLESDRPNAIAQLKAFDSRDLQAILQTGVIKSDSLVNQLGKSDPDLLCSLLSKLVVSSANEDIFLTAIGNLSLDNPEKATALLESLPDGETKKRMISSQFEALARESSAVAIERASKLTSDGSKIEAYRSIGAAIGGRDLDAIMVIADALPENFRNTLLVAALPTIADKNPMEAIVLLEHNKITMDSKERQEVLASIGERISNSDASYAKEWLAKLPSSDQPFAMKGIATEMVKSNIQELATMLGSMPQDKKWEAGVRVLIDNIRDSDPEMAKKWQGAMVAAGFK